MQKLYIIHGWTYKPEPWLEVIKDLKESGIDAELLRVPGLGKPSKKSLRLRIMSPGQKEFAKRKYRSRP